MQKANTSHDSYQRQAEAARSSKLSVAERYYGSDGLYLDLYANGFGELTYVASERANDRGQFSAILEARFTSCLLAKQQIKPKRWWRAW
jgi:hypothetical protein